MFLYGTPNLVSNMNASIHLFGGANDSGERAQENRASAVRSPRQGGIGRLFGATNKKDHKNELTGM
jgi:hypothetical protein